MAVTGAKQRQARIQARKERGLPHRGDREAGHGKSPYGPRGGRNRGRRGRERSNTPEPAGVGAERSDATESPKQQGA